MRYRIVIPVTAGAGLLLLAVCLLRAGLRSNGANDAAPARPPAPADRSERLPEYEIHVFQARPARERIGEPPDHAPIHICLSPDGQRAYVVNREADSVSVLDVAGRWVLHEIPVGWSPAHAVLSPDGRRLYVSCTYDYTVQVLDLEKQQVVQTFPTGYEPIGLALSADGQRLSVANSLANTVSIYAAESGERRFEVPVGRLPRYLAETPDGTRLIVANAHSRDVSIVDPRHGNVIETRPLGRAAQMRQVLCSRDGCWALVATLVGHDEMVTVQMERGWINSNGFSVLDLSQPSHFVTLLLDQVLSGATNPWGLALSPDERRLYVALSGIHQVAIIDLPKAIQLVGETTPPEVPRLSQDVEILARRQIARRVEAGGLGPRSVAVCGPRGELLVANYFSDTVSVLDAESGAVRAVIRLGPDQERTLWREGEMCFNDGRICYQNWTSCASCHQEDATMDSLNWDLINDGTGNPKNAKSMHNGLYEPPAMWSGVRGDQHVGVLAGQRFLGFLPDDEIQRALMEYIGKPRRAPNPYRRADPDKIARGRETFYRARCDVCHIPPLYSDKKRHDLGLAGYTSDVDFRSRFDTPSLLECYRTGPYLHDGRAQTLHEIFAHHNPENLHGLTRGLTAAELDDLVAFLRSL
jgi:YVTN family beta-propeller protein